MKHSIVFFGTPKLAVPFLEAIVAAGFRVPLVITQPDHAAGRGHALTPPPVKLSAQILNLPILQAEKCSDQMFINTLAALKPDLFVVVAYGAILPPELLSIPKYGCINMHASLLPAYRGASPIQGAILAGERQSGWTVMLMDEGLDTGPILAQKKISLEPYENAETLSRKLVSIGPSFCLESILAYLDTTLHPQPQPHVGVSLTKRIQKSDGLLDWRKDVLSLERQIRAYQPWPGGYTFWKGVKIEIVEASIATWSTAEHPGTVIIRANELGIACGGGVLIVHRLKPAGKATMPALDFSRGRSDFIGAQLG